MCTCHRRAYMFNFDHQFEIHDDVEVLRRMGHTYGLERGHCDIKVLKTVLGLMPTAVHRFITGLYGIENTTMQHQVVVCLLYTSPSPRDGLLSRMPSSA